MKKNSYEGIIFSKFNEKCDTCVYRHFNQEIVTDKRGKRTADNSPITGPYCFYYMSNGFSRTGQKQPKNCSNILCSEMRANECGDDAIFHVKRTKNDSNYSEQFM